MTRDIEKYISGLEYMAASLEADARWNWPDIPIDEIPDGHSCMAREEPKMGTVRNRISFFREIAALLKGLNVACSPERESPHRENVKKEIGKFATRILLGEEDRPAPPYTKD